MKRQFPENHPDQPTSKIVSFDCENPGVVTIKWPGHTNTYFQYYASHVQLQEVNNIEIIFFKLCDSLVKQRFVVTVMFSSQITTFGNIIRTRTIDDQSRFTKLITRC
jgi:hypothetical protein